jgi:hypothetical protein
VKREKLVRDVKREALARMEDAARTEEDFKAVIKQWDHLDENRERKERYHEMQRSEQTLEVNYTNGMVFPVPISRQAWREAIKGNYLPLIYDSAFEVWQLIEDGDIAILLKKLTDKQKIVLYLNEVLLCPAAQIAICHNKTDRAVRKLLAETLDSIRGKLIPLIQKRTKDQRLMLSPEKCRFLERFAKEEQKKKTEKKKPLLTAAM